MNKFRTNVREIMAGIRPLDEHEAGDVADVLQWIDSGEDLWRRRKPDVPPKHLVSYFVPIDWQRRSLLLVDHVKSGLWLPPGGHVEPEEDPRGAAVRELAEELGPLAAAAVQVAPVPLFVTVSRTKGEGSHIDVSLWYTVMATEDMPLVADEREFNGHRWLAWEAVLQRDIRELDPQMHRFIRKMQALAADQS